MNKIIMQNSEVVYLIGADDKQYTKIFVKPSFIYETYSNIFRLGDIPTPKKLAKLTKKYRERNKIVERICVRVTEP